MKYAIFSDIHGNLEALNVVLKEIKKESPDIIIFCGDLVGYGPDPIEVIEKVKDLTSYIVAGNHDWGVVGKVPIEYFNAYAKEALLWTKDILSDSHITFLKELPLVKIIEEDNLFVVHSTPSNPEEFSYIVYEEDVIRNMEKMKERQICFVGHSHIYVVLYYHYGELICTRDTTIFLPFTKVIVNAGSVGQPRDRDPRAVLLIYDSKKRILNIKRFSYDWKTTYKKIKRRGLPEILGRRLFVGE